MPRQTFYSYADLSDGYDPNDYTTFVKSFDFQTFLKFTADGGESPKTLAIRLEQASHDAGISFAVGQKMQELAANKRALVGVMGGHSLARGSEAYNLIADICRRLTKEGYMLFSGGGPGAMEACHLGAYFANCNPTEFQQALADLAMQPTQPSYDDLYDHETGALKTGPEADKAMRAISDWCRAGLLARSRTKSTPGDSLAVPTWVWGTEPTNPFATCYAKFYQDGLREQHLIKLVQAGMIFAHGGGGTMRELFQLIETNYYVPSADKFIPMIFVDPSDFWRRHPALTDDRDRVDGGDYIDVRGVLQDTFDAGIRSSGMRDACMEKIVYTTDYEVIRTVLAGQKPVADTNLKTLVDKGGRALRQSISRR